MLEIFKHLTGACGEHSHPNLLNLSVIFADIYIGFVLLKYRLYGKVKKG